MAPFVFLFSLALAAAPHIAHAQFTPLASKSFDWNNLPYQADTDNGDRGRQHGYNRCNSTTENQQSLCQTAILNSIDDFCIWGPPDGPATVGATEGEAVAWCTKPGHGTRIIPSGALKGVQFMRTPDYVQVVGFIDQTQLNVKSDDGGGEMDPHGADLRGNPLGGLVFSNAWSGDNKNDYKQVIEWHDFFGSQFFCFKTCDPARPNAPRFCEHIYDRIGCAYNAPNNAQNGVFEACDGDNQDYPGIYTDSSGNIQTYSQPPESLGEIATMPYQPKVPASSNCVTYTSSAIYAALPTASGLTPSSIRSNASGLTPSSVRSNASGRTSSSARSTGTGTSTGAGPSNTAGGRTTGSAAGIKVGSAILSMSVGAIGVVFAILALA